MDIFLDSKLLQKITNDPEQITVLTQTAKNLNLLPIEESLQVQLDRPSFFTCMGGEFPLDEFNVKNPLFDYLVSHPNLSEEVIIRFYDQIFVECLTKVKSLPYMQYEFLSAKIEEREKNPALASSLFSYREKMKQTPYPFLHDLILYLGFDLVCIRLAILFENIPTIPIRLEILKSCLVESFNHIKKDGKTSPGFFRLTEALYAYQMREEKLKQYSEEEWAILCKGTIALRSRNYFLNVGYIDLALSEKNPVIVFTSESSEIVKATLALAKYNLSALGNEYQIEKVKIVCTEENLLIESF